MIGRVSGGEPELGPELMMPKQKWEHCGERDFQVSMEVWETHDVIGGLRSREGSRTFEVMGSKDGQINLRMPWICHQHQRALWFILQVVGNRKEFNPTLSYIPSLDNLTEAVWDLLLCFQILVKRKKKTTIWSWGKPKTARRSQAWADWQCPEQIWPSIMRLISNNVLL